MLASIPASILNQKIVDRAGIPQLRSNLNKSRSNPDRGNDAFLDAAMRAGRMHHYGISNFTGWQMQLFGSTAWAMGVPAPVTLQQQYSLVYHENEYDVVPAAQQRYRHSALVATCRRIPQREICRNDTSRQSGRLTFSNPMNQHRATDVFSERPPLGDARRGEDHRRPDRCDAEPGISRLRLGPGQRHGADRRRQDHRTAT